MDENCQPMEQEHSVFLRFFSKERHRIYRFIFSLLPNHADAEDVFQQASVILWKKFGDFDQNREFYPWACRVAFHAVLNYRRSAKRHQHILDDDLLASIAEEQIEGSQRSRHRLDLLDECISLLKTTDRDLLRRVYEDNASAENVATQMGRAVQTIYNRLNLIRSRLMDCVNRKAAEQ